MVQTATTYTARVTDGVAMRIATIGAGNIGRAFASLAIEAGHEVLVSNSRDPKTLDQFARESGALTGSADDAAAFGDLVLVAIPFVRALELEQGRLAGKIVVDANNYYPERDGAIRELDDNEITTSELVARRFPDADWSRPSTRSWPAT
ncbi:NADPH-dependent F420 reductase [Caulobacter sp. UC70_42]|uniref:NADPH-dependent F420 reductase n=1 Tax=Caulobacter sp. UC70_42 TaxID=3374551 RepID=UPI003757952C